ncbi:SDR family oxidoreductase [Nonomuraea indica]|uniref:SDR family oxidoreductase n=1 Tax=Nonomuraea indica TaxID=1581193 RepID=UPI000C7D9DE2|nr:NmrA family NAD(P)-binding protein [Nonomuraea indica]
MRVLVFGAGGAQGGAVARRLADEGHAVRGLSRTGAAPDGVEPFRADLGDAGRVAEAFAGVTHASVVLPLEFDPVLVAAYVRNVVEAATAAGVRRLVFCTGNRLPAEETGVPAFETRRAAARAMLESPVPSVVLCPPLYLENLAAPWVREGLAAEGVLRYPVPAGVRAAWLSHADLAAATLAALTGEGLEGATLDLGGEPVTGPELAAAFGARYEAVDVDAFEAGLAAVAGARTAAGVAATYRWIAGRGHDLYAAPAGGAERLGITVTSPAAWASAPRWASR